MSSQKKIKANRHNSENSTGPKTQRGKENSRLNAQKHGLLSREPTVTKRESPVLKRLHSGFRRQLPPATPLRQMASDRSWWAYQCSKLAMQVARKQLKVLLDAQDQNSQNEVVEKSVLAPRWYEAGKGDLRSALRVLRNLLQHIESKGFAQKDEWKDSIVKLFGPAFYRALTEWPTMSRSAILMVEHLSDHVKKFGGSLPSQPEPDTEKERLVVDPHLSWAMAGKLITLEIEHLEQLVQIDDDSGRSRGSPAMDLLLRYYTTATRELERAVRWYGELKQQGL